MNTKTQQRVLRIVYASIMCVGGFVSLYIGWIMLMSPRGGFNLLLVFGPLLTVSGFGLMRDYKWGRMASYVTGVIMTVLFGLLTLMSVFVGDLLIVIDGFFWTYQLGPFLFFVFLILHLRKTSDSANQSANRTPDGVRLP